MDNLVYNGYKGHKKLSYEEKIKKIIRTNNFNIFLQKTILLFQVKQTFNTKNLFFHVSYETKKDRSR